MPIPNQPILFSQDATIQMKAELISRYDELTDLEKKQIEIGSTAPNLYATMGKFVANPSNVSVETYQRMLDTDETIGAGIDFLTLCMVARFGQYKHPVPEIELFVRRALAQMDGSWQMNLIDMLSAEWAGFSTTEMVWKYDRDFDGFPAFVPKKLVTYPPLTMVYAVDQNGEILPQGIYQYQRYYNGNFGGGFGIMGQGNLNGFRPDLLAAQGDAPYPIRMSSDLAFMAAQIPRDKVIHLTSSISGSFRSPYGKSPLRRMYKNWVAKDAFMKMWIVAADRRGTPLVVAYAPPNDTVHSENATNRIEVNGPNPQRPNTSMRSDQAVANALSKLHNSSFVVIPGKKDDGYLIEAVPIQGDLNVYQQGMEYFNRALMRGMLVPPLLMSAGDGAGSFALGQTHDGVFRGTIDGKNKIYQHGILNQFIAQMLAYNFPRKLWEQHGVGSFLLEDFDPEVMQTLSGIYANMADKGFMDASDQADFDYVRDKLGLPRRAVTPRQDPTDFGSGGADDAEGSGDAPGDVPPPEVDPIDAVTDAVDQLSEQIGEEQ